MSSSPFAEAAAGSRPGKVALIVAAAIFQGVLLVGMIAVHAAPLMMGQTIRLKVEPVDPRDLFRGDYVILGYDFSNTPPDQITGLSTSGNRYDREHDGREVYISLQPAADGEYHEAIAVSLERPAAGPYLRGTISGWSGIRCGIEAYYVQEGQGHAIEQAIRERKAVYAEVAVWNGQARLKNVVIE